MALPPDGDDDADEKKDSPVGTDASRKMHGEVDSDRDKGKGPTTATGTAVPGDVGDPGGSAAGTSFPRVIIGSGSDGRGSATRGSDDDTRISRRDSAALHELKLGDGTTVQDRELIERAVWIRRVTDLNPKESIVCAVVMKVRGVPDTRMGDNRIINDHAQDVRPVLEIIRANRGLSISQALDVFQTQNTLRGSPGDATRAANFSEAVSRITFSRPITAESIRQDLTDQLMDRIHIAEEAGKTQELKDLYSIWRALDDQNSPIGNALIRTVQMQDHIAWQIANSNQDLSTLDQELFTRVMKSTTDERLQALPTETERQQLRERLFAAAQQRANQGLEPVGRGEFIRSWIDIARQPIEQRKERCVSIASVCSSQDLKSLNDADFKLLANSLSAQRQDASAGSRLELALKFLKEAGRRPGVGNAAQGELLKHLDHLAWQMANSNQDLSTLDQELLSRVIKSATNERLQTLPTEAERKQLRERLFNAAQQRASQDLEMSGRGELIHSWIDIARKPIEQRKERCISIASTCSDIDLKSLNDADFKLLADSLSALKQDAPADRRADLVMRFLKEAETRLTKNAKDAKITPEQWSALQGDLLKQLTTRRPNDGRPDMTKEWPIERLNHEDLNWLRNCLSRRLAARDAANPIPGLQSSENYANAIANRLDGKPLDAKYMEGLLGNYIGSQRALALQLLTDRAPYLSADGWHQQLKEVAADLRSKAGWVGKETTRGNRRRETQVITAVCFANDTAARSAAYEFRKQTGIALNIRELKPGDSLPQNQKVVLFSNLNKAPTLPDDAPAQLQQSWGRTLAALHQSADVYRSEKILDFDAGINYLDLAAGEAGRAQTKQKLDTMLANAGDASKVEIKPDCKTVRGVQAESEFLHARITQANNCSSERRALRSMMYFDQWSGRKVSSSRANSAQLAAHVMSHTIAVLNPSEMIDHARTLHSHITAGKGGSPEDISKDIIFISGGSRTGGVYRTDSSNHIAHLYRVANGLAGAEHDSQFVTFDQAQKMTNEECKGKTFVLLDDAHYTGSKGEVEISSKLARLKGKVKENAEVVYGTLGAHSEGLNKVRAAASQHGIRIENVATYDQAHVRAADVVRSLNGQSSGEFRVVGTASAGDHTGSGGSEISGDPAHHRAGSILGSNPTWNEQTMGSSLAFRHTRSNWTPSNVADWTGYMGVPSNHNETSAADLAQTALTEGRRGFATLMSPVTPEVATAYRTTMNGVWHDYGDQIITPDDAAFALEEGLAKFISENHNEFSDSMDLSGRPVQIEFGNQPATGLDLNTIVIQLDPKYSDPANLAEAQEQIFWQLMNGRAAAIGSQMPGDMDATVVASNEELDRKIQEVFHGASAAHGAPGDPAHADPPGRPGSREGAGDAEETGERSGTEDRTGTANGAAPLPTVHIKPDELKNQREAAKVLTQEAFSSGERPKLSTLGVKGKFDTKGKPEKGTYVGSYRFDQPVTVQTEKGPLSIKEIKAQVGSGGKVAISAKVFDISGREVEMQSNQIDELVSPLVEDLALDFTSNEVTANTSINKVALYLDRLNTTQFRNGSERFAEFGHSFMNSARAAEPSNISVDQIQTAIADFVASTPLQGEPVYTQLEVVSSPALAADQPVAVRFTDTRNGRTFTPTYTTADQFVVITASGQEKIPMDSVTATVEVSADRLHKIASGAVADQPAEALKLYAEVEQGLRQVDQIVTRADRVNELAALRSSGASGVAEQEELALALARADERSLHEEIAAEVAAQTDHDLTPSGRTSVVTARRSYHLEVGADGRIDIKNARDLSCQRKERYEDWERRFVSEINEAFEERIAKEEDLGKKAELKEQRDKLLKNEGDGLDRLYARLRVADLTGRVKKGGARTLQGAGLVVSAMIVADFAAGMARGGEPEGAAHASGAAKPEKTGTRLPRVLPASQSSPSKPQSDGIASGDGSPRAEQAEDELTEDEQQQPFQPIKYDTQPDAYQQAIQDLQKELGKQITDQSMQAALSEEAKSHIYGPVTEALYRQSMARAAANATEKLHEFARAGITNIPSGCPITLPDNLARPALLAAMSEAKVELKVAADQLPSNNDIDLIFNTDHWNSKAQAVLDKPQQKADAQAIDRAVALAERPGWKYKPDKDNSAGKRLDWETAVAPLLNLHNQATATMESLKLLSGHIYNSNDKAWLQQAIDQFERQGIGSIQRDSEGHIAGFKVTLPETPKFDRAAITQMQNVQAWIDRYSARTQSEMQPLVRALNLNQIAMWNDVVKDKFDGLPPLSPKGKQYNLVCNRFYATQVPESDKEHGGMIRLESITTYHKAHSGNVYNMGAAEVDRKTENVAYYKPDALAPIVSGSNLYLVPASKLANWQSSESKWHAAHKFVEAAVDIAPILMGGATISIAIKSGAKALTRSAMEQAVKQTLKGSFEIALGASGGFFNNASTQQYALGRAAAFARGSVFVYGAGKHVLEAGEKAALKFGSWLSGAKIAAAKESEEAARGFARLLQAPAQATFAAATPWFLYTMGKDKVHDAVSAVGRRSGLSPHLERMGVLTRAPGQIDSAAATELFLRNMERTAAEHFLKSTGNILTEGKNPETQAKVQEALRLASQTNHNTSDQQLGQTQKELEQRFSQAKTDNEKTACAIALLQCAHARAQQDKTASRQSQEGGPYQPGKQYLLAKLEQKQSSAPDTRFAAASALFQSGDLTHQEFVWECDRALKAGNASKELQMQALLGEAICTAAARAKEGQGSPQEQYEYASRSFGVRSQDLEQRLVAVAGGKGDPDLRAFAGSLLHAINRSDQAECANLIGETVQSWQAHKGEAGSFAQSFLDKMQTNLNYSPTRGQSMEEIQTARMQQFSAAATLLAIKGESAILSLNGKSIDTERIRNALADCVSPNLTAIAPQAAALLLRDNGGSLPLAQADSVRRQCVSMLYGDNNQANFTSKLAVVSMIPQLSRGANVEEISSMVRALSSIIIPAKENSNYAAGLPDLRRDAVTALATINCQLANTAIERLLTSGTLDPSAEVRETALKALEKLHPHNTSQILTTYLKNEHDLGLRETARSMLGQQNMRNDPSPVGASVLTANSQLAQDPAALQTEFTNHRTEEWFKTNFPDLLNDNFMAKVREALPSYMSANEHFAQLTVSDSSLGASLERMYDGHQTFDYADPFVTPEKRISYQVKNLSVDYQQSIDTLKRWAKGEFKPEEAQGAAGTLKATREEACRAIARLIERDGRAGNGLPLLREWDRQKTAADLARALAEMCRPGGTGGLEARKQAGGYLLSLLQNNNVNPQAKCELLRGLMNLYQPAEHAVISRDEASKICSLALESHRKLGAMPEETAEPKRANYPQQWHYDKAHARWESDKKYSRDFQVLSAELLVNIHMNRQDGVPLISRIAQESKDPYIKARFQEYAARLDGGVEIAYLAKHKSKVSDTVTPLDIRASNIVTAVSQANSHPGQLRAARHAVDVIFDNMSGLRLNQSHANEPLLTALRQGLHSDEERVRLASAYALTTASDISLAREGIDAINDLSRFGKLASVRQDAASRLKIINREVNNNISDIELRIQRIREARKIAAKDPARRDDRETAILARFKTSNRSFDDLERRQGQLLAGWTLFRTAINKSASETSQRYAQR